MKLPTRKDPMPKRSPKDYVILIEEGWYECSPEDAAQRREMGHDVTTIDLARGFKTVDDAISVGEKLGGCLFFVYKRKAAKRAKEQQKRNPKYQWRIKEYVYGKRGG